MTRARFLQRWGAPLLVLVAGSVALLAWPTSSTAPAHVWTSPSSVANSAEGTARAFARHLGFTSPYVHSSSVFANSATVDISPVGPIDLYGVVGTTTRVSEVRFNGRWLVTGCTSSELVVYSPRPHDTISGILPVRATTTAYEAVVNVELRTADRWQREWVGTMKGGSMGVMGPASALIALPGGARHPVALVLLSRSARDGGVVAATVVSLKEQASK